MRNTNSQKPASKRGPILLASGLPTAKPNSFSRQLSLLGKTFAERGWSVFFIGIMAADKEIEHRDRADVVDSGKVDVVDSGKVDVVDSGKVDVVDSGKVDVVDSGKADVVDSGKADVVDSGKADVVDSITYIELNSFSEETLSVVLADINPAACILLGYPDQFPFIFNRRFVDVLRFPVYLWSQFSKPQELSSLGYAQIVPLTWMTMMYLVGSGVPQALFAGPVIPHGTDTRIFRPASIDEKHRIREEMLGNANPDFVIGSVGANSTRKRFDRLIEGFSALHRNNKKIKLVIKTDRKAAPQGFDLERLCMAFEVGAGVEIITGEFDVCMLARLYKTFDIYMQVSEWEGFCIPVIEAMSSGLPVFSTPIQGPAEIIPYSDLLLEKSEVVHDGNTILRWASADGIAKMAEFAIGNPARLKLFSIQGREESVHRFDIHAVAARWESLIISDYFTKE